MLRKSFALTFILALLSFVAAHAQTARQGNARDADRAAIRASIEGISQAFIDGDIEKIHATHSEDWRGFLEGTQEPIRGLDEYMKANGLTYPPPANASAQPAQRPASQPAPPQPAPPQPAGVPTFKIFNFDVNFYTPDMAVACFMIDFGRQNGDKFTTGNRLRIMDVYARRASGWIQVASHTVVDPAWRSQQTAAPANLSPRTRQQIMDSREEVWRAWFSNDRTKLDTMLPEEAIAVESGSKEWQNRAAILDGAKRFAESGAKLVRLEFPRTEIQMYGNTVILYTSYLFETEKDGKRNTSAGSGVETFVRRGNKLVNTGWLLADEK
ncbi:MAG: DUF4440 domain-containing protein [Pyrinomonadaceae bacterium]